MSSTAPKDASLGEHQVTIKDDLGNQAQTSFKVSQNNIWNPLNFGIGLSSILLIGIGWIVSKILLKT